MKTILKLILSILLLGCCLASAQQTTNRPSAFYTGNAHDPLVVTGAGSAMANDIYLYDNYIAGWVGTTNGVIITNALHTSVFLTPVTLVPFYTNVSKNPTATYGKIGTLGTNPVPNVSYTNFTPVQIDGFVAARWSSARPQWPLVKFVRTLGTNTSIPVPLAVWFTNGPPGDPQVVNYTWAWTNGGAFQLPGAIDIWMTTNGAITGKIINRRLVSNDLASVSGSFIWTGVPGWTNGIFYWRYRTANSNSAFSGTFTNRIRF